MTESNNLICMQGHLIDRGTTVPVSLRVFTRDSLFRTQSEFISTVTCLESTSGLSSLMEGSLLTDARLLVRAQVPAAVQSLFISASSFCVGGDLSTSLSALSLSLCGLAAAGSDPMITVPCRLDSCSTGWLFVPASSVVISVQSDWMRVRSFLDCVMPSRGAAQPGRKPVPSRRTQSQLCGGFAPLVSGRTLRL